MQTKIINLVKKIFKENKKTVYYIAFFSFLFIFSGEFTFAEVTTTSAPATGGLDSSLINGINTLFKMVSVLLGILTWLISLFLEPGWQNGSIIGLTSHLKDLWILVSNLVYVVFAGLLIWIAFMNIIGKEGDNYQLKQALPKFIIGILIVPFSWFIVQFVLSMTGLFTAQILTLPLDTFKSEINDSSNTSDDTGFKFQMCDKFELGEQKDKTPAATNESSTATTLSSTPKQISKFIQCSSSSKKSYTDMWDYIKKHPFGIMNIYTYGVMRLDEKNTIFTKDLSAVGNILQLIGKLGLNGIFIVIYLILLIAIFMALCTRGFYLWLYTVISPMFGLQYFFGDKGGEAFKKYNIKEFIALAMVPVYVAGALSFGLLFLFVAGKGMQASGLLTKDGQTMTIGGTSITLTDDVYANNKGFIGGLQGAAGSLLSQFFALIILWMAVMAALKSSKITAEVTQPFAEMGVNIGKLMQNAPKHIPVLPGGLSPSALSQVPGYIDRAISQRSADAGRKLGTRITQGLGLKLDEKIQELNRISNRYSDAMLNKASNKASLINDTIKGIGPLKELISNPKRKEAFVENLKRALPSLTDDQMKSIKNSSTDQALAQSLYDLQNSLQGEDKDGLQMSFGSNGIDSVESIKKMFVGEGNKNGAGGKEGLSRDRISTLRGTGGTAKLILIQEGGKTKEEDIKINSAGNTKYILGENKNDNSRIMQIAISDTQGDEMTFSSQSNDAFINSDPNKLVTTDKNKLITILNELSPDNKKKLLKDMFKKNNNTPSDDNIDKFLGIKKSK